LSGRGLCEELITRPEESYRLCCVVVCDLETSRMGAPYIYDISRLRVNWENNSSGNTENPENWIFSLKIVYSISLKWKKKILQTSVFGYIPRIYLGTNKILVHN